MQTIMFINPLKSGKLEEYKAFIAHNTNEGKAEYTEMLKRYGLHDAKAWSYKLGSTEFVVVTHKADDSALKLLEGFAISTHPYDQWFVTQLNNLHDFQEAGMAPQLLNFICQ